MRRHYVSHIGIGLLFAALFVTACSTPTAIDDDAAIGQKTHAARVALHNGEVLAKPGNVDRVTGMVWAKWGECEDGGHEGGHGEGGHSLDTDDGHEDGDCKVRRPAREFRVRVEAHDTEPARGSVKLHGVNEYDGIWFKGPVTWYGQGSDGNEAFFGGRIEEGTAGAGCYLVGVQDNGEGKAPEGGAPDRIHYRLYGSAKSSCHVPDHFPRGFPAKAYRGNMQVHSGSDSSPLARGEQ